MHEHSRSRRLEPIVRVAVTTPLHEQLDYMPPPGAALLRDGRLFLGQLGEAVNRQQALVEHARGRLEAARAQWLAMRMDREALEKVVTRFRAEEERDAQRHEQREQDECAARRTVGAEQ